MMMLQQPAAARRRATVVTPWWLNDAALRGWWPLETNADDYGPNGYHLTLAGDANIGGSPAAMLLDRSGDYAYTTNPFALNFSSGSYTWMGWWRLSVDLDAIPDQATQNEFMLVNARAMSGFYRAELYAIKLDTTSNRVQFGVFNPVDTVSASFFGSTTAWDANRWYHTAVTFDGFAYRVYLNGVSDGQTNSTSSPAASADWRLFFGGNGENQWMYGAQGNWMALAKACSADEILAHFAATKTYYGVI